MTGESGYRGLALTATQPVNNIQIGPTRLKTNKNKIKQNSSEVQGVFLFIGKQACPDPIIWVGWGSPM